MQAQATFNPILNNHDGYDIDLATALRFLGEQAALVATMKIGDADNIFGEPLTAENVALSLERLAEVALSIRDRLQKVSK